MRTFDYLFDSGLYWPPVLAGLAIVLMCGVLSPLVVVKRLAFVGQGVSHSAFGGIGVAALLAALTPAPWGLSGAGAEFAVVVAFCIAAAMAMAAAADRRAVQLDTAIGVSLVASMTLGIVLVEIAKAVPRDVAEGPVFRGWEPVLFGSILAVGKQDAQVAGAIAAAVIGTVWWLRRPLIFWAFDEAASPAFGVRAARMRSVLMVLLAVAVVTAMKLAGVILATALLVLPGAASLRLSDRLAGVMAWSCALGVGGLLGGLVLSFEADMPPGASIVLVMTGVLGVVWAWAGVRGVLTMRGREAARG